MVHYGQLVPKGLYGWGGYGGSGEEREIHQNQSMWGWEDFLQEDTFVNVKIIAVFLWDQEKELGFVYIPTYLAW